MKRRLIRRDAFIFFQNMRGICLSGGGRIGDRLSGFCVVLCGFLYFASVALSGIYGLRTGDR